MTGPNLVINSGMNGAAGWNSSVAGDSSIVWSSDHVTMKAPSGNTCNLTAAAMVIPIVVGITYEVRIKATRRSGLIKVILGGQSHTLAARSGIQKFDMTATGVTNINISREGTNVDWDVHWVGVYRKDVQMARNEVTMRDFDGDKKTFSYDVRAVTDGASWSLADGDMDTILAAITPILGGNVAEDRRVYEVATPNDTDAASAWAQCHSRVILEYKDATTDEGPYQLAMPTADLGDNSLWLSNMHYDPANAQWTTLISALETAMKNPRTGNGISVLDIFLEE